MNGSVRKLVNSNPRVVILEDDAGVRRSLQLLLQGRGFDVKAYASPASLLADPEMSSTACLVADYHLGQMDGIAVLESLRARGWNAPAILITAFGSAGVVAQATAAGFATVLEKPFKDHALVTFLERLTTDAAVATARQ